ASAGALLPIQYNAIVQGLIYSSWNERMASFVHGRGFPVGARSFRLFVFSRLSGDYERQGEHLRFRGPVTLQIASPVHALVEELASSWLRGGVVRLGDEALSVDSVDLRPTQAVEGTALVRTLSPVTVY